MSKTYWLGKMFSRFIKLIMGYDPQSSVLIVGMPSSGKSTYLWSLVENSNKIDGSKKLINGWCIGDITAELQRVTTIFKGKNDAGTMTQTVAGDYKHVYIFRAWKQYLRWVPFHIFKYEVFAPEVPGEWVKNIIDEIDLDPNDKYHDQFSHFKSLFFTSSALIVLTECGSDPKWREKLCSDFSAFQRMLRRTNIAPIYRSICVVLSKADDSFREFPGQDLVRLPANLSYWSLLNPNAPDKHPSELGNVSEFKISQVIESPENVDNAELQEAMALDFLRAHAPEAARILSNISQREDVKLMVMFGSSTGLRGSLKPLHSRDPINLFLPFAWTLGRLSIIRFFAILTRLFIIVTVICFLFFLISNHEKFASYLSSSLSAY